MVGINEAKIVENIFAKVLYKLDLHAITNRSPNRCISLDIVQQMLRARTGRSPNRNIAQSNALGYGCKNKLARCKRKRKKEHIPVYHKIVYCRHNSSFLLLLHMAKGASKR